jgi:hypothetical protein
MKGREARDGQNFKKGMVMEGKKIDRLQRRLVWV